MFNKSGYSTQCELLKGSVAAHCHISSKHIREMSAQRLFAVFKAACDTFLYMHDHPTPYGYGMVFGLPMKIEIIDVPTWSKIFQAETPKRRTPSAREEFLEFIKEYADTISNQGMGCGDIIVYFYPHPDTVDTHDTAIPKNWNPWMDYNNPRQDMAERRDHISYHMKGLGSVKLICKNPFQGDVAV